jgi:hypothetical protein
MSDADADGLLHDRRNASGDHLGVHADKGELLALIIAGLSSDT